MNKIDQINEAAQSLAGQNIKSTKDKHTDAFENALNKALDKTEGSAMEHMSANALKEIISKNLNVITSSDIVSGQTDKLLGMLDLYSSKLVDPNISLKSIAPVVEEIKDNAESLRS